MRRDKDTDTGNDYNIVEFSDQWLTEECLSDCYYHMLFNIYSVCVLVVYSVKILLPANMPQ